MLIINQGALSTAIWSTVNIRVRLISMYAHIVRLIILGFITIVKHSEFKHF